jgi:acyl-CoA reductase-like NAD-dependent aldehyde dehydrogenase
MEPVEAVVGAGLASTPAITTALDRAIAELRDGERAWGRTPPGARRELLLEIGDSAWREARSWVEIAARIKGLDPASPLVGEEWIRGPYALLSSVSALAETVGALASGNDPLAGYVISAAPGERTAIEVLPHGFYDRVLLSGYRASVWMRPDVSVEQIRATAGLAQRAPRNTRGVALVLGAGNITSIAPLDVLYQLYAENRVVVLKLNPVLDGLRPVLDRIFAPFIRRDLVRIVTGGAPDGTYLAEHPAISAVHMTGSAATHDTIVFGSGADGAARKAASHPRLDKPVTSELGGVSPVIVVPGRWSDSDLRFQAEHVATMKLHNAGHNCIAAQILLLPAAWPKKQRFLELLHRAIADAPARPTWYEGANARAEQAAHRAGAKRYGDRVLVGGLDIDDHADSALRDEWFAPVLGIAELPGEDPASFIRAAVDAANQRLHGTLGANVIAHPRSIRALGRTFEDAIAELRYGTIAVNAWTGLGYLTPRATWGAFPGHRLGDIQSGRGVVHNALLLKDTERTVVRGPFRPRPKPPWFITNRTSAVTAPRLTAFAAQPKWTALAGIFASAVRG